MLCRRVLFHASSAAPRASCDIASTVVTGAVATPKKNLLDFSRSELQTELVAMGLQKYRADQLFRWMYIKGVSDFHMMTDIRTSVRESLAENFDIHYGNVGSCQTSIDGTRKWLLGMQKNANIETVFIPESEFEDSTAVNPAHAHMLDSSKGSVCVSSQVGCSLSCSFCRTATMAKSNLRNLTSGEIVGQVMNVKRAMGDFDAESIAPGSPRNVANIVFMGMGEPLYNYRNVKKALDILMDEGGLSYGRRKVTVSTSGVVPMIERLGRDTGVNLAISLHATRDDLRNELVPINKTFPLHLLLEACRKYPGVKNSKVVTWEYVMLKDVNDSLAEARDLVKLVAGIPSLINLIPFNPWPGSPYQCSSNNQIRRFQEILNASQEVRCTVRWPRGRDILAACGQLAVEKEKQQEEEQQQQKQRQQYGATSM